MNDQKDLIINLLEMIVEDIKEIEMPPHKQKADLIIGDLYQAMRQISDWSEGMR